MEAPKKNRSTYEEIKHMMLSAIIFEKSGWKDYTYDYAIIFGIILNHFMQTNKTVFNLKELNQGTKLSEGKYQDAITAFLNRNLLEKAQEKTYQITDHTQQLIKQSMRLLQKV